MRQARKIVFWTLGGGSLLWAAFVEPTGYAWKIVLLIVSVRVLYVWGFGRSISI